MPVQIQTFGQAWDGTITFGIFDMTIVPYGSAIDGAYLIVMKTDGTLLHLRHANDWSYLVVKNIALNTLMFQGEPLQTTHLWDLGL
jgi:hypothetical protein